MRKTRYLNLISIITLVSFLNLLISCSYYKVVTPKSLELEIQTMELSEKYVIVHYGDEVWHLDSAQFDNEKKVLIGIKKPLSNEHEFYKTAHPHIPSQYKQRLGEEPIIEIHLYLSENLIPNSDSSISVPLKLIRDFKIFKKDVSTTIILLAIPVILIAGAFVGLVSAFESIDIQ